MGKHEVVIGRIGKHIISQTSKTNDKFAKHASKSINNSLFVSIMLFNIVHGNLIAYVEHVTFQYAKTFNQF
jgi:hypothetical protein